MADIQHDPLKQRAQIRNQIINAYDNFIVRLYCNIRFRIINLRILEELEQYVPAHGQTLDLGCGFGLFSLYFAACAPGRSLTSIDLSAPRIELAKKAAARMGLSDRTNFQTCDVMDYDFKHQINCVVTLDILHHLPPAEVPRIIKHCYDSLPPGGIFIAKDVDSQPWPKMAFTWLLDKAMSLSSPVHYYPRYHLSSMLSEAGFDVKVHQILDVLPYPHVLYVCRKV